MENNNSPIVMTHMLIRKPVEQVFNAFIDPVITTKFWFTKSSGKIETGKEILWEWEMYGVSSIVKVRAVKANELILIDWGEPETKVEWKFIPKSLDTTFVKISNWGFSGTEDEIIANAINSMGGFSFLLAGLKAFLEYNVVLNLVADHFPEAHVK
jgi:uncharacterized protein YndB with AHSA1/START domain